MSLLTWAATQSGSIRLLAAFVALALLAGVAVAAPCFHARDAREARAALRRLHLQQANIVAMLLKAGFRPPGERDWHEDEAATRVLGKGTRFDTVLDLRPPQR